MQQYKKALDHVVRVRHVVAMIVHPSKAAALQTLEHIMRNLSSVAKCLKIRHVFCLVRYAPCRTCMGTNKYYFSFPS